MRKKDFFIVAIGTSAGGLPVLREILKSLPEHNNAAFIIIQHLKRDIRSISEELLAPYTKMHVYRAHQKQVVKTGCVYVLPEDKMMTIKDGRLHLVGRLPKEIINRAIDIFFESMGPELKERSIGMVLTGQGADGTDGAVAIHNNGGLMMVQSPGTAQFRDMPQSMVNSDRSNFTMPIDSLISTLAELIRP